MQISRLGRTITLAAAVGALGVAGCGGSNSTSPSSDTGNGGGSTQSAGGGGAATGTLVIDQSFVDRGVDPGREFTPTNNMLVKAMYDTLVTFEPGKTEPGPVARHSPGRAATTPSSFTFTLDDDADVLRRHARHLGRRRLLAQPPRQHPGHRRVPARRRDGHRARRQDRSSSTSKKANPALLRILATPPTSILNSKVAQGPRRHGCEGRRQDRQSRGLPADASAGSGPYTLAPPSRTSSTRWRPTASTGARPRASRRSSCATWPRRRSCSTSSAASNEIALDLSAQQAETLKNNDALQVTTDASVNIFDVEANMNASISPTGRRRNVRKAIRLALDYEGYTRLSGVGAVQAPGVIPSQFLGALPPSDAVKHDLDAAKAGWRGQVRHQGQALATLATRRPTASRSPRSPRRSSPTWARSASTSRSTAVRRSPS